VAFYSIQSSDEFSGATVIFPDGSTQTIASDNANYETVVKGLLDGSLSDDQLLDLIAPFEAIYKTLTKLSERVSRKGSKLLFDGDVVSSKLSNFIIELMNEGKDEAWKAYVAFMEKLYTNPSEQSREHLFHFIEDNGLQLTADGDLLLYKGTKEDGKSTHAGYGIVNGVEFQNDYLQNALGAVVEIPRSLVDEDRGSLCSTGLHVGAFEYVTGNYVSTWPRLWLVLVNPRDVVAVPHDYHSSKIRVTRYVVVGELGATREATKYEGLIWTPGDVAPEADEFEEDDEDFYADEYDEADYSEYDEDEDEPIQVQASAPATVAKSATDSRVEEYKKVIRDLIAQDPNVSLRRYRSKKVTAARRGEFKQAAEELGFKL